MKLSVPLLLFAVLGGSTSSAFAPLPKTSKSSIKKNHAFILQAARAVPDHPPPPPPPPRVEDPFEKLMNNLNNVGVSSSNGNNVVAPSTPLVDSSSSSSSTSSTIDAPSSVLPSLSDFKDQLEMTISGLNGMDDMLQSLKVELEKFDTVILEQFTVLTTNLQQVIHENFPSLEGYYNTLVSTLSSFLSSSTILGDINISISPSTILAISSFVTYITFSALFGGGGDDKNVVGPVLEPYPGQKYNPDTARIYFRKRLPTMIGRGLQVLTSSLSFVYGVLIEDKYFNANNSEATGAAIPVNDNNVVEEEQQQQQEDEDSSSSGNSLRSLSTSPLLQASSNDIKRGEELAQLLTKLGPTYIKVGQSLSIRTDLLSPGYVRGLSTLQDNVPAFDSDVAYEIISQEWGGKPLSDVVSYISPEPIAAASLGQVYKATLKEPTIDGITEVAIKVQRPNIRNQIALDMHLLREIAPIIKKLGNLNSDTVGTVDAWGTGFVDELDYLSEAQNAQYFTKEIAKTPLKDVVFCPQVVDELSTNKVLVSQWIDGERLDESSSEDVTLLCSVAMNTYLTMLLEIGLLHCDPHPGNLLRTIDGGKLCILDWGMVTKINTNLQLTLIEHVAHLTSADYDEIPRDLLLLDFIPQNKAHLINDSGVVEVLAEIYGAWSDGGGAAAINVNKVISQLQDLTAQKGNLFQIPPYFAYIAKSFSVLEGIGLSNDKQYSIINECLPYISQRLLTDEQNMGPALSTFIFGPEKSNIQSRVIDYDRVEQLVTGFGNYTTSASSSALSLLKSASISNTNNANVVTNQKQIRKQLLSDSADQILDLIFTEKETPFQNILVEQLAKIVASSSRNIFTQLRERSGTLPSGRTVLGTIIDPLGLFRTSPLVRMNDIDEQTVETTRKLLQLIQSQIQNNNNQNQQLGNGGNNNNNSILNSNNDLSNEEIIELTNIIITKLWERRNGIRATGNRFMIQLLTLVANKLDRGERDTRKVPKNPMTTTTSSVDDNNNDDVEDEVVVVAPKMLAPATTTTTTSSSTNEPALATATTTTVSSNNGSSSSSARLTSARKLLNELTTTSSSSS